VSSPFPARDVISQVSSLLRFSFSLRTSQLNKITSPLLDALPVPLSETKPHTLSLRPSLHRKTSSVSQLQSIPLGKLPPEIRVIIWKYTIGNQEVHIVSKFRRIGHAVCDAGYWAENQAERPGLRASSYMFTYGSLPTTKQLADWNMLSLLRTCRLMYVHVPITMWNTVPLSS
jgi:hypothetical protein